MGREGRERMGGDRRGGKEKGKRKREGREAGELAPEHKNLTLPMVNHMSFRKASLPNVCIKKSKMKRTGMCRLRIECD
jgi:hypothetical protein